jgi:hypothetical protein
LKVDLVDQTLEEELTGFGKTLVAELLKDGLAVRPGGTVIEEVLLEVLHFIC